MPTIFCYTKPGRGVRSDPHYPGHEGLLCDWEQAVHLAWSRDGKDYRPLRNNTGILFARTSYEEDPESGVGKTLADPWLFRDRNGKFGLCVIRRNRNLPDSGHPGSMHFSHALNPLPPLNARSHSTAVFASRRNCSRDSAKNMLQDSGRSGSAWAWKSQSSVTKAIMPFS